MRQASMAAWLALICLTFTAARGDEPAPSSPRRPNVLILIADDVDGKDYGCYGNPFIRTPNIDALAKEGLRFTRAFLTTSSCSPTRISILTGKYPHATGAEDLHAPLPRGEVFLSTYLRQAGYFTGHMLKTHYGPQGMKQFQWYERSSHDIAPFLDAAGERPFFLWVGFREAHRPYEAGAVKPPHDPATVKVPPYLVDTPETRADLALYYDEISRMDGHIGAMVAELKRRGLWDNTLTIFCGDNGRPFPRAKGTVYDSGIATPLVVSWPAAIGRGQTHDGLASVIDLAPTVLEAAGVKIPAQMQGQSMLDVLKDPGRGGRELVFSERNWHNGDEHIRAVRSERYKLIRNAYLDLPLSLPSDCTSSPSWTALLKAKADGTLTPQQKRVFVVPRPEWELYDLEADPDEFENLAERPELAEVKTKLQQALASWQKTTGDFSPEVRRRADNCDRITGVKFSQEVPPLTNAE